VKCEVIKLHSIHVVAHQQRFKPLLNKGPQRVHCLESDEGISFGEVLPTPGHVFP